MISTSSEEPTVGFENVVTLGDGKEFVRIGQAIIHKDEILESFGDKRGGAPGMAVSQVRKPIASGSIRICP